MGLEEYQESNGHERMNWEEISRDRGSGGSCGLVWDQFDRVEWMDLMMGLTFWVHRIASDGWMSAKLRGNWSVAS
jgi:hypothetical protein